MKPTKPETIDAIAKRTRRIAKGISPDEVKLANDSTPPRAPETLEGKQLRALAHGLRTFDWGREKTAALISVLDGNMPSQDDLHGMAEKVAFDLGVEKGETPAITLRNLASRLRTLGSEIKTAAHVEAFKVVRAHVAAEKLSHYLGA